ncbi:MAG: hypothetical protein ACRD5M_06370 [Candidatus Acidiferrales bacterium]
MNAKAQQETKQQMFARVLGQRPRVGPAKYTTIDQLGLFTETFGPPEITRRKNHSFLFWNFTRDNGSEGFSLISRIPRIRKPNGTIGRLEVEVRLVARTGFRWFWWWTADRLAAVESGEETPLFLSGGKFCVKPLN